MITDGKCYRFIGVYKLVFFSIHVRQQSNLKFYKLQELGLCHWYEREIPPLLV